MRFRAVGELRVCPGQFGRWPRTACALRVLQGPVAARAHPAPLARPPPGGGHDAAPASPPSPPPDRPPRRPRFRFDVHLPGTQVGARPFSKKTTDRGKSLRLGTLTIRGQRVSTPREWIPGSLPRKGGDSDGETKRKGSCCGPRDHVDRGYPEAPRGRGSIPGRGGYVHGSADRRRATEVSVDLPACRDRAARAGTTAKVVVETASRRLRFALS